MLFGNPVFTKKYAPDFYRSQEHIHFAHYLQKYYIVFVHSAIIYEEIITKVSRSYRSKSAGAEIKACQPRRSEMCTYDRSGPAYNDLACLT
jgi:hypothetical protein